MYLHHRTVGDITMATVDEGVGVPLVLLHGFPLDHSMWRHQVEHLSGEVRVIAPDLRGYGESELGDIDSTIGVPMEQYADDLNQLLDELEVTEPIVLGGFSMGGYVLWQFLNRHPHRVRAIVLCDTRAGADDLPARQTRHKMAEHINVWGAAKVAEMMTPKLFSQQTFDERPEVVKELVRLISEQNPAAIAAAQRGMAARADSTPLLRQILAPTLVIVGSQDAISTPAEMEFIAGQIPGACLQVIDAAGHMAPVEQPEAVTTTLRHFLRQL